MKRAFVLTAMLSACGGPAKEVDGGAGGSATTTTTGLPCPPAPLLCPSSPVTECPVNATRATCCQEGAAALGCEVPAGLLTTACPSGCNSGLCAASRGGTVTCCAAPGLFPDPCFVSTP